MAREIEAPFNENEVIYTKDVEGLKKKVTLIKQDGLDKLHIFTDFDFTLTRRTIGDKPANNSFGVIENVSYSVLHA